MPRYKLKYAEGNFHWSAITDQYYGGLTVYEEEFNTREERDEYIRQYRSEWCFNPNWGGCYVCQDI